MPEIHYVNIYVINRVILSIRIKKRRQ